jgi:hypothetical protein
MEAEAAELVSVLSEPAAYKRCRAGFPQIHRQSEMVSNHQMMLTKSPKFRIITPLKTFSLVLSCVDGPLPARAFLSHVGTVAVEWIMACLLGPGV